EDATDWDWNDLRMLFEPLPDGNYRCTAYSKDAGYTFDLMDGEGRVIVANFAPPASGILPGGRTSYGINGQAHRFTPGDSHKGLAVEFKRIVADGPPSSPSSLRNVAPGHMGVMPVLFMDGHAETFEPFGELDPRVEARYNRYWRPTR